MRALRNLAGRGEVTASPRARVAFELYSTLHRRGGQGAPRSGWYSGPTSASTRRSLHTRAVVDKGAQDFPAPIMTIRMPYRVQFGEVLRVVGSSSLLGDWSADQGLQLTWSEGDVWIAEVPIDAGHYEFKCVVYNVQTNSVTRWEDGGNRVLNITQEPGMWDVDCKWGATADMTQAFLPAPAPPAPATPDVPEATAVEEAPAEEAVADAVEELLPTFMALSEEAALAKQCAAQEDAKGAVAAEAAASAAAAVSASAAAAGAPGADAGADGAQGGGGAIMLFLATCAAGAVAAVALLAPGGMDKSLLGGRASEAVSSTLVQSSVAGAQVREQVQSQLAALAGHVSAVQAQVSAVQPAVRAQLSTMQGSGSGSVTDGLSSVQPTARSGVAFVTSQAPDVRA